MRLRLILSFILITLVSITSVVLIARKNTATEVRAFMFRGGMAGTDGLVNALEEYYQENQSWQGVNDLFATGDTSHGMGRGQGMGAGTGSNSGVGMMNQRLRLADENGNIIADTTNQYASGSLDQIELDQSISLVVYGHTVGYLLPEGGMGYSRSDESELLSRLNNAAITAGIIALVLSLILAFFLAYRLLRPVQELTKAANKLALGDLSQRVPIHGKDEIAGLGQAFNQMAASLQASEESRRAMTADIAHELRNPLAVQRANLEAMHDGIYPLTTENLDPVLEQNHLLNRMVDDLRTLALADSGELQLEYIPTDLVALVNRVVEQFIPQANTQKVNLKVSSSNNVPLISLDPGRVKQILGNLLSNALRYTPEGGQIDITTTYKPPAGTPHTPHGIASLIVRDNGPGIPTEALPHIFDRFYRVDRARSRSEGGTGLGLPIALKLAQALGGTLTAQNHPNGGAIFTLTVPVSS
jgi:signal transduction histidine kinase